MAQIHRASPEQQQSPHLPTPTPQLPVLPPSLCLVTSEGVRREAARGSWLSAAPQYPRPSVSSAHALPCGEPQLGPPPVWDRSREPERLALPVLSLLCPFFPLLPAFSLSPRQLPSAQPRPAPPHQLQLGPSGTLLTHRAGKDSPEPAGAAGVSSGLVAGASSEERGQSEVTEPLCPCWGRGEGGTGSRWGLEASPAKGKGESQRHLLAASGITPGRCRALGGGEGAVFEGVRHGQAWLEDGPGMKDRI